jgi:hypothetical protein
MTRGGSRHEIKKDIDLYYLGVHGCHISVSLAVVCRFFAKAGSGNYELPAEMDR